MAYKVADQRGLHLFVAPTGLKSFRLRFRIDSREQTLTIGGWPEITLDQAREAADLARAALARGEDPRARSARPVADVTFEAISRRWHAHWSPRWSPKHAEDVLGSLVRDIFPAIGAMPIGAITTPVVLAALRQIEAGDRIATARRVQQRISKIYGFAISEGLATSNPAAIVGQALQIAPPAQHHPALLAIDEVRALLAAVDQLGADPATVLASRFLALTAVRLNAVRGVRWDEIEDLDGAAPLWRVPAARMKLKKAQKASAANDHLVPLAPTAVAILRAARANLHPHDANSQSSPLIFPGRGAGGQVGEKAIGALYERAGYTGRHVPHGWRSSFSTIMNAACPGDDQAIERALAHAETNRVKKAYDRGEQLAARLAVRRRLFEAWAEILMPACRGDDVGG